MNRKSLACLVTVLTGLWIYSSCTKIDTTALGAGLIPEVDNINTFDTVFDVTTDLALFNDTTRLLSSELHPIGIISNDPEFGKTEAATYVSLTPSVYGTHPFTRKDSVTIDSVVLSLAYSTLYGDSNSVQDFDIYEIDPNGNFKDSTYMIKEPEFTLLPGKIGTRQVAFTGLNDSLAYVKVKDTIRTKNELRIKIDTAWGRHFVLFDTAAAYKSDSAFRTHFVGLAIKPNQGASPAPNAIAYFDINNASTQLTFYCRKQNNGATDTITTSFTYGGRNSAGLVRRTPANGYQTYLTNGNPNDDKLYIQSSPGSYATVKIPNLANMSNRVIHRAELILEELPSVQSDIYTAPAFMFIDALNAAGDTVYTIRNDFIPTTGGGYDIASLEGNYKEKKYKFNLSRYVQSIITKKQPSYTLRVHAPYATVAWYQLPDLTTFPSRMYLPVNGPLAAGRVVLGGGSHPTQKMRLRIIYSKI